MSQSTVSWIERGRGDSSSLGTISAIAGALDADVSVWIRWRGGDLDRLLDVRHAALGEKVGRAMAEHGWSVAPEVTFSVFGERGSIDLLASHPDAGAIAVIELKTEIASIEEMLRRHDVKCRLAAEIALSRFGHPVRCVGKILLVADSRTNRRRVEQHSTLFGRVDPERTVAVRRWLRRPDGPIAGLAFLPVNDQAGTRQRVRAGSTLNGARRRQ